MSDGNNCLNRKIKEIKVNGNTKVNYEANLVSSNEEKGDFLYSFLPPIKAVGRDLKNESANKKWTCGLYSSLLESKDKNERVIQVIIIWTRQRLFLKRFFSLILFSLSILSIIQLSSIKSISDIWFIYSIYLISLYISAFFLYKFFIGLLLGKIDLNILLGILGPIYGLLSFYDLNTKFSGEWGLKALIFSYEIYLPITAIFLVISSALLYYLHLYESKRSSNVNFPLTHNMDYAPLWIFLEKKGNNDDSDPKNWKVKSMKYDFYHNAVGEISNNNIGSIGFEIRNRWHSFNPSIINNIRIIDNKIRYISFLGVIILFFLMTGTFWGNYWLIFIQTIIWIILIRIIISFYNSSNYQMENLIDYCSPDDLSKEMISDLWNLNEKKAQLKLKNKITDPFNEDVWKSRKWNKDVDDSYKLFSKSLRVKKSIPIKIYTKIAGFFWTIDSFANKLRNRLILLMNPKREYPSKIKMKKIKCNEKTLVAINKDENKFKALDFVLKKTKFDDILKIKLSQTNKTKEKFLIAIKPNIMMGYSKKDMSSITDPELVEFLVDYICKLGYRNIIVVESQNVYGNWFKNREVLNVATHFGYTQKNYKIVDLTEEKIPYDFGPPLKSHWVGKPWKDADFRISFAKNKTHPSCHFTLTIKNIYGCLPLQNKFKEYHQKLEFDWPTIELLKEFPCHYGLIDAFLSADGLLGIKQDLYSKEQTKTIIGGENIYAVEYVGARKMGFEDPRMSRIFSLAVRNFGMPNIICIGDQSVYDKWDNVPAGEYIERLFDLGEKIYWLTDLLGFFTSDMDTKAFPVKSRNVFMRNLRKIGVFISKTISRFI